MPAQDTSSEVKRCPSCDETKPLHEFHRDRNRPTGRKPYCKICTAAKQSALRSRRYEQVRSVELQSRAKYKDIQSVRNRIGHLRRVHGLTPEDYDLLMASQANSCAACGDDVRGGGHKAHIDHDHGTGRIRAILCHNCNVALGLLGDSPVRVAALLAYVKRFK